MAQPIVSTHARLRRRDALWALWAVLLAAWVHRSALGMFFTPDDLIHLQQAAGLTPTLPTPFRVLSQVLYFRAMLGVFGPNPLPFHLVTWLFHLLNVILVFALARRYGCRSHVAGLAAALFGSFPLFGILVSSAVGINDELALAFVLLSLLALVRPGAGPVALASVLLLLGLLCKESVVFVPLLALVPTPMASGPRRRVLPLLVLAALVVAWFVVLGRSGLAPGGRVYATAFGPNVFHNLMTYLAWAVNVTLPMPDLVSSFDPQAWRTGLPTLLVVAGIGAVLWRREPAIRIGLAWFVLGLLPVLPLQLQTYRHYLYPALPGLALVVAAGFIGVLEWLRRRNDAGASTSGRNRLIPTVVLLAGALYALQADRLVWARLQARVPGTQLAFDPVQRRREVAQNSIYSIMGQLPPGRAQIAILTPVGAGRVFGARSGREFHETKEPTRAYNLLVESLDHGRAVKLFCPWVDSVAFIDRWSPAYDSFALFLPYETGHLAGAGVGVEAHRSTARWMMEQRWYAQARDHLRGVLELHADPSLRLAYGAALLRTGDSLQAVDVLRRLSREAGTDSAGIVARAILEALERGRGSGSQARLPADSLR